jgi:hypothetical protein
MDDERTDDVPTHGEGNHDADREYREGVKRTIEEQDVERKAEEAKRDLPDTQKR